MWIIDVFLSVRSHWVVALVMSLLLACCSPEAQKEISFTQSIQPVINEKCFTCHFGGRVPFDLTLDNSLQDLLKYVIPGKPEASRLYVKVKGGHPSTAPMTKEELELLKEWIMQGGQ